MKFIFNALIALSLLGGTAYAGDPPTKLEITGTVVSHDKRYKNSAIVNDSIWWEGQTLGVRTKEGHWLKIKLLKVEHGKATFEESGIRKQGKKEWHNRAPRRYTVRIKKSTIWGLGPLKKKEPAAKEPAKKD